MKVVKSIIAGSILLLLSGAVAADNPFARAEIIGNVSSVFPKAGVMVINGSRYRIAEGVKVITDAGKPYEGGVEALTTGMSIQFGLSNDAKNPGVSVIIVSSEQQ